MSYKVPPQGSEIALKASANTGGKPAKTKLNGVSGGTPVKLSTPEKASLVSLLEVMRVPDADGNSVGYDEFRAEIVIGKPGAWRPFTDVDYVTLREQWERGGLGAVGEGMAKSVVLKTAMENTFDTAIEWGKSLVWDGTPRVAGFLKNYLHAAEAYHSAEYHTAVSLYWWTAMAGRLMDPGCKADMVPVMISAQGTRKSSTLAAMVESQDHFSELDLGMKDVDLSRLMRGRLLGELAELTGLFGRHLDSTKAFITRTHEVWTPKWKEFATSFPRRLILVGTTNDPEFLDDPTGERRWLPFRAGATQDVEVIKRDRKQLWAEAIALWSDGGIQYQKAEELAKATHSDHKVEDVWTAPVSAWLEKEPAKEGVPEAGVQEPYLLNVILLRALGMPLDKQNRSSVMRLGRVMTSLGYVRKKERIGGTPLWGWRHKDRPAVDVVLMEKVG